MSPACCVPADLNITYKENTMSDVADAVEKDAREIQPAAAAGLDLVFGFNITDEDKHYALIVKDGTCEIQEGENPTPTAPWCWTAKP
jgi:hypothetical protein